MTPDATPEPPDGPPDGVSEDVEAVLRARLGSSASGWGPPDLDAFAARADASGLIDVAWTRTDSPIGPLTLAATESGLCVVSFAEPDQVLELVADRISPRVLERQGRLDDPRRQLDEYFEGRRRRFELTLDRRLSRGFRAEVLQALESVGFGRTVSYRDLAGTVGRPTATRAVGSAMATNPLPIVVPCHRVLRTGGALGGYAGGLDAKRWLLAHEGAPVPPH